MGINANVSGGQQITASVGETKIDVAVSGGVGPSGAGGPAATITVGTVTTGAPGSSASVVNAGTTSAAVLNFTIPAGATGPQGPQGATGPAGTTTWAGITDRPATFPPSTHTHVAANITDFAAAVVAAAPPTTNASLLTSGTLPDARLSANIARTSDVSSAVAAVVNAAPAALDTLNELAAALGNDASFATTVTNSLSGKAALVHTHVIGDVTGLQTALDGKQASGSYAASVHTHGISDVTGLQTALDGKQAAGSYAAAVHTHGISDVTGLQTALDGKAAVSHTHTVAQISDFSSALASPPAIGGTTPAAGSFTTLAASTSLAVPSGASGTPAAGHLYRSADTIRYRDSSNAERMLLNSADNLANLGNTATARANLGLGTAATANTGDFAAASHTHAASAITSGTVDAARLPIATATQSINGTANVLSTPALVLRQLKNWKLANLSDYQRDITVSGSQGSISTDVVLLTANNGFATANATVVYRGWAFDTIQYYTPSGQNAGTAATNWSWTKPLAFAFRIACGPLFAATGIARVQFGKKLVTTIGAIDQQGVGVEIRGNSANTNARLWILAHNGTTLTSFDTGFNLNCAPFYDILLTTDGAGNVSCVVNDTAYTTTGGPTTDLINAASGSGIGIEVTNGNTANSQTRFYVSRHIWVTAQ